MVYYEEGDDEGNRFVVTCAENGCKEAEDEFRDAKSQREKKTERRGELNI